MTDRYLAYAMTAAAEGRSTEEARARGCDMVTTTRWWTVESDPETGAAVLLIPEGDEGSLAPDEIARLTDVEPAWRVARREAALAAMGF